MLQARNLSPVRFFQPSELPRTGSPKPVTESLMRAADLDTARTFDGAVRGHVHVAVGQHAGECQTSAEDGRVRDPRELGDVDQRLRIDVAHDAIAERGELGSVRSQEKTSFVRYQPGFGTKAASGPRLPSR